MWKCAEKKQKKNIRFIMAAMMMCIVVLWHINCMQIVFDWINWVKEKKKKIESFVVLYIRFSIMTIFTFDKVQWDNCNFQPLHIVNDFSLISKKAHYMQFVWNFHFKSIEWNIFFFKFKVNWLLANFIIISVEKIKFAL